MKWIILLACMQAAAAAAQDCTTETVLNKAGSWKAGSKGSESGTAVEIAAEKKTVTAQHTMIRSKYVP